MSACETHAIVGRVKPPVTTIVQHPSAMAGESVDVGRTIDVEDAAVADVGLVFFVASDGLAQGRKEFGPSQLTAESINNARLENVPVSLAPKTDLVDPIATSSTFKVDAPVQPSSFLTPSIVSSTVMPSAPIARLQILLDRAGASPGVIDGLDGTNVRNAVSALELMRGLPVDGRVGPQVIAALDDTHSVIGTYMVGLQDTSRIVANLPRDYAEMASLDYLGYTTVGEAVAERFHMDVDFLRALNPKAAFKSGETILVADIGGRRSGKAVRVDVSKKRGQVEVYDREGKVIAAYPATVGSQSNPSPSGIHVIKTVVKNPTYTYDPKLNFKQGNNDKVLTLPPGPNNPVGTVWIDLSEPTFGIHGTPEPARIDKSGSHGCVRLTNWDAQELAGLVTRGVPVRFLSN